MHAPIQKYTELFAFGIFIYSFCINFAVIKETYDENGTVIRNL